MFSLKLCHTHVYMTLGPLSSEHTFEKGKSRSDSHHPSKVSKDFPFPKPFPLNLAKSFLLGWYFCLRMIAQR